jgi:general nucleoside transport system permease protein
MNEALLSTLNSIVANATPLVIAALGETITERSGVINLSLDGSLALSALAGFAAAVVSGSLIVGIAAATITGALIALLIAIGAITLRQDQVAVGFVLTLLAADLAQFLGQEYARQPGPFFRPFPMPMLGDIPFLGRVFFQHDAFVYFSYVLIAVTWLWLFYTRWGLEHRAVGERPAAAHARGTNVNGLRFLYTLVGGGLVGLAGAAYSLSLKAGWQNPPAMRGDGWVVLAIVIFGGWHPFRVVLGAYLFAALRALASAFQRADSGISPVLLNAIPWVMMILTLVIVSSGVLTRLLRLLPGPLQRRLRTVLRVESPASLGTPFQPD